MLENLLYEKALNLMSVFKALDLPLDINRFDRRMKIQKRVYMLQLFPEFRRYLNFDFSIYFHGPYSPDLANTYYNLPHGVDVPEIKLSEKAVEYGKTIAKFSLPELEIISTLAEAIRINGENITDDELIEIVHELKPYYCREKIEKCLEKLHELRRKYNIVF
ncbi:MAG: hypothetical protein NDF54_05350 [archaeon GB-1867-035]|nr:hypothetical protein [Candidatus Culexmicrobium profundum]